METQILCICLNYFNGDIMEKIKELYNIINSIEKISEGDIEKSQKELDKKMKPKDSLGILEIICKKMAGIYGYPLKDNYNKCHIVASADNGIIEEGVSSCPVEYTSLVSEAMLNNLAAIGIFTKKLNIDLNIIDIGMKLDIEKDYKNLFKYKIRRGTENFTKKPAMKLEECISAIFVGINFIKMKGKDFDIFSNGEMGVGNTTTSSALLYSLLKGDINEIVGRGGGLSDEGLEKKKKIIIQACDKYNTYEMNPIEMIAHVGGLDIACMLGLYIGAAFYKKLILVDGFISAVAALLAIKLNPKIKDYILFTHKSEEPGMNIILTHLNEKSFLNLNMRLGEGTGAVFAYSLIDCAVGMINTMKSPKEIYDLFLK